MRLTLSNTLKIWLEAIQRCQLMGWVPGIPPPPPGTKVEEKENWRLEILATALRNERQFQS